MGMAVWALITYPPDLPVSVNCYDNTAKMSILGVMPLTLQQRAELADIWP